MPPIALAHSMPPSFPTARPHPSVASIPHSHGPSSSSRAPTFLTPISSNLEHPMATENLSSHARPRNRFRAEGSRPSHPTTTISLTCKSDPNQNLSHLHEKSIARIMSQTSASSASPSCRRPSWIFFANLDRAERECEGIMVLWSWLVFCACLLAPKGVGSQTVPDELASHG